MPHLFIRGITVEEVQKISRDLVQELAEICSSDTDNFTLEVVNSNFVFDGQKVKAFPLIEVKWFERGQEIQDQFAQSVTKHVHSLGIPEVEVAFSTFLKSAYYYNGRSFAE